jgi:hypothetical protein
MRTRGAVAETGDTLSPEPVDPAVRALTRHSELFGDVSDWAMLHQHPLDEQNSAPDIEPGISVRHETSWQ